MDEASEPSATFDRPPAIVQVVGAPGSGKSLLITLLTEALIARGIRPATAERICREDSAGTVIGLAGGGRISAERVLPIQQLRRLVGQLDPRAAIILAERYEEVDIPAIAIGDPHPNLTNAVIWRVEPETVIEWWERGPESAAPLAELIERLVIGRTPAETFEMSAATRGPHRRRGILGWLADRRWTREQSPEQAADEQTD